VVLIIEKKYNIIYKHISQIPKKQPIMKKTALNKLAILFFAGIILFACKTEQPKENVCLLNHPEWSINANLYEVNVRQFTKEGTFTAFSQHLERLNDLGVNILWFMPISPVGELNRKGTLGSYYSIQNYTAINPEFGTLDDFKAVVNKAHELGMYVIIDWVANHTSWDHVWTVSNPEYFVLDEEGNFTAPNDDWTDVLQLNYENPDLWDAMIAEMKYWVEEANIDGFRCDVAYMVPTEFWNRATKELMEIKTVFMLAEADSPELNISAFHSGYGWHLHHVMNSIAQGKMDVSEVDKYFFEDNQGNYPKGAYKIYFTSNHDENSWKGSEFERMGDAAELFGVLSATVPGMFLMYNGQEAGLDRRLEFFEKDEIDWSDLSYTDFYEPLLKLNNRNKALWNGLAGGPIVRIKTDCDEKVFAFMREKDDNKVVVILNMSDQEIKFSLEGELFKGNYTELFTQQPYSLESGELNMLPWGYLVLEK